MEPLAPHEKIFVDTDFIEEDENHGGIRCHTCHGGDPNDPDWKTAHKDATKDPTYPDPSGTCGSCHETKNYGKSLHTSLQPFELIIGERETPNKFAHIKIKNARKNHCNQCHSSCGQCHISRPNSVEGGLLDGHIFQKTPPMKQVCTACHGSRIGKEFFGENKGLKPDIHHEKYMKCSKCHSGEEMHGDGKEYPHRYAVENGPKCIKCHKGIYSSKGKNIKTHTTHKDKASCFVCHSQPYKNCYSCHLSKKNGIAIYKIKPSIIDFKIGFNPLKSDKRPEKFVTLRHAPIDEGTFDYYVRGGLKNFDNLPTWKMATPHNIRRKTTQNYSCNSCHGNSKLFLLEKDVLENEKKANQSVIVPEDQIPGEIDKTPR